MECRNGTARPPDSEPARILIVDDHPLMCQGLAGVIDDEADLGVCGVAHTVPEARRQIDELRPDLVVIDLFLEEGGNGLELIKWIQASVPGIKVLVVSMQEESLFAERSLRAGALGYVHKHEPAETVLEAVRRVLRGATFLGLGVADAVLTHAAGGGGPGRSPLQDLTDREIAVFEMLGRGLAIKQIAAELGRSSKTIQTHCQNMRSKLGLAHHDALVRHAVQWLLDRDRPQ